MSSAERSVGSAVLWLAGAALSAALAASLALRASGEPEPLLWASLATQGVWIGIAVGLASLVGGRPRRDALALGPPRLRVRTLLLLGIGLVALSNGLSLLLGTLELRDTGGLAEIDALVESARGRAFALALLALGVGPGIAEELLFRGLLQTWLARRLGPARGILLAAAGFAVVHLDWVHAAAAFCLGIYLGAIRHLARSVRASMFWHVVNNLLALLSVHANGGAVEADPRFGAAALLLVATAILWTALRSQQRAGSAPGPRGAEVAAEPSDG